MKIGLVLDDSLDKPDGVQQYVLSIGSWLAGQGHTVRYLVGETHRRDVPDVYSLSNNINVRFNQNRMSVPLPARSRTIRQVLHAEQFDVLHVQMPYSPMLAAKIIREASDRTAVIGTFHILPYSRMERMAAGLLARWLRPTLRKFDGVVSVSEPAAAFAKATFGIEPAVLPNVIDTSVYAAGKRLARYDDGKTNIVFLGRLVERKGCMALLRAVTCLRQRRALDDCRVVICGKGPLEPSLRSYVEQSGLSGVVEFAGFVPEADKPHYLASADIAVFPSSGGESFGIVLIEAMAAGAEVVLAGDNPGYASVMGGHAEQLVSPADTRRFADVLESFVADAGLRQAARAWQKTHVRQFDVGHVAEQLQNIYAFAIAKRNTTDNNKG